MDGRSNHQRSRPSMESPSKTFPQAPTAWTTYDNPLFDEHRGFCQEDYFKAELEKERRLRKKAEAASESLAKSVAEERKRREAAERKAEELNSKITDVGRPRSVESASRDSDGCREANRQQQQRDKKEVENPHIKRGIVGFVEFPKMLRNRRGGTKNESGGGGDSAANLECQKAQFRVLLKSSNKVNPLGNLTPSSGFLKRLI